MRPSFRRFLRRRRALQAGFTLIEILAAVAILGLMALFLGRIFSESSRIWKLGSKRVESNGSGRAAIEFIARELNGAIVDDKLEFELRSDADSVQFGSVTDVNRSDRLTFATATHAPMLNSNRNYQARQVRMTTFRVMKSVEYASTNYVLLQHNWYSPSAPQFDCYVDPNWTSGFDGLTTLANSSIIAQNVRNFEVFVYNNKGQSIPNYKSWIDGPPAFVDIYLEVLAEDDNRKANLGLASKDLQRMTRRFHTRVNLPITMGYSRDALTTP